MAKFDFRGLIPGKKYKIVVIPETANGDIRALPAIDFVVPEAPPRARNYSLTVTKTFKNKIVGYKNRRLRIWKYRIAQNSAGQKIVTIITGRSAPGGNNRVKAGDKIRVLNPAAIQATTATTVLPRGTAPSNRIKYLHPNQAAATTTWLTYGTDDSSTDPSNFPVVHVNGGAAIIKKIPVAKIRTPKAILNNLVWNDTVRDVVHIVYRKAKKKSNISGKRRYLLFKDGDVNLIIDGNDPIQIGENGFTWDDFPKGMPPVTSKQINDELYYSFEFIIARYIKKEDGTWKGYWIERNTPFAKRLSKPRGWK